MAAVRAEQETMTRKEWQKHFFHTQVFGKLPYPSKNFTGQTIIVTGSNTGLGLEAVRHFTRLDAAKVILACRSVQKGNEAAESVLKSEQRPGVVEVWELDLASYESTKRFAKRAQTELERLDVVVANAGVYLFDFKRAEQDEETITINVISTFLLGIMLLPKLRETATAHKKETVLTFTGSFVHHLTSFPEASAENIFDCLNDEKTARMEDRYNVSKAIELFLVRELATRMTDSKHGGNVITSVINPGYVRTSIMRHNQNLGFKAFMLVWKNIAGRTPEVGGRTLVFAAYGGSETHGRYLDDCVVGKIDPYIVSATGHETQVKLWRELSARLESIEPGVMSIV